MATVEQWREISTRVQESADAHAKTAVILERLSNALDAHAKVDEIRFQALEHAPDRQRASLASIVQVLSAVVGVGGCLISPVIAGVIGVIVGVLVYVVTLVIQQVVR